MKKYILLVVLLLLTGCTVSYNIEFKDDKIFENFTVNIDNNQESDSIKYLTEKDFYAKINPEMVKYKKDIIKNKNETNFNYSYEYDVDDYKNSMALSSCFSGYSIIKESDYYLLSTSTGVKCMTSDSSTIVEKIDIVIKSNHKLIETNADEILGYKYVWHIDKSNYLEKSISLKLYQDKYVFDYNGNFTKIILVVVIAIVLITFSLIMFIIKRKNSNQV